jgi:hypothetical protein
VNTCTACGKDFGSLRAFERHRVGDHARNWSLDYPSGRRCLTEHELEAAGFCQNRRGEWTIARDLHRARGFSNVEPLPVPDYRER